MISIKIKIIDSEVEAIIDLPEEPPTLEDMVRTVSCCQFDFKASILLTAKIKDMYGEQYFNSVVEASSDMIRALKELLNNSLMSNSEMPLLPTIFLGQRAIK